MAVKINKPIKGSKNKDTLTNNYQSGYAFMSAGKGNDTYIINNITKTATEIDDKYGKNSLEIKNVAGKDLSLFFPLSSYSTYAYGSNELLITNKSQTLSALKAFSKLFMSENYKKDAPQKGIVFVDYFFSEKAGSPWGKGYMQNIYTTDSKGAKYLLDIKNYYSDVVPKVQAFLRANKYNSSYEVLFSENASDIRKLLNIYQNTAMRYKITGSKNADKLYGGGAKDNIKGNDGNDKIWGYGGNDIIKGGNGNDTIKGGAGNDSIYGEKGNDNINAGSGNNLIYFAKNDGKDTILNGSGTDTLVFTNEKLKNIKAKYSDNNVILTYTGGQITLKDYKNGHSAQYIKVSKTQKAIDDLLPCNVVKRKNGSHNLTGTNKKDKIIANHESDIIKAYNGNDYIELSVGKATVYAGKGNDTIWDLNGINVFYFNSGDGHDVIKEDRYAGANLFIFKNEKNINGLKFSKTSNGYKISYNGNNDSITVKMNSADYKTWSTSADYMYANVVRFGNDFYLISANGFVKYYASYIYAGNISVVDEKHYDTFTTTNGNDCINSIDADNIRALGGNDVIVSNYSNINIWGGKGNDFISANSSNLYFGNGDGNDKVYYSDWNKNTLIFSGTNSFDDLNIQKSGNNIIIKYNNDKDSVTLMPNTNMMINYSSIYFAYGYIKIANSEDKYYILKQADDGYDDSIKGIIGTKGSDILDYRLYGNNNSIITCGGDDTINLYINKQYDNRMLQTYFNVIRDGEQFTIGDKLYIDYGYWSYDIDYTGDDNCFYLENSVTIEDYFSKSGSKTIVDISDDSHLDMTAIETVKGEVAQWLADNGSYDSVIDAINDQTYGESNFRILMGEQYFGQLQWVQNNP